MAASRERRLAFFPEFLIVLVFFIICLGFAIALRIQLGDWRFFSTDNQLTILRQASFTAMVGVGMTFVILTGGIDLSVGGVVALSGVVGCMALMDWHSGIPLALVVGVAVGAAFGIFNGSVIAWLSVPPFIATLATWFIAGREGGLAFLVTNGETVPNLPDGFTVIGQGRVSTSLGPGIPVPALIMLVIVIIAHLVLRFTRFGRHVYAIGGNEEAARLSGIAVRRVKVAVYVISGALAGLASMIAAARLGSGDPKTGVGWELDAIAAVVVGGTSIFGGRGSVLKTLIGALLFSEMSSGLTQLGAQSFLHPVIKGGIILLAVLIDQLTKRSS